MDYVVVKWVHIVSSTFLFGTGVGSAFYLLFASLTRDAAVVAFMTRWVVVADWLFTATTMVVQPASGLYLAHRLGIPLTTPWLWVSLVLFAIAAACWAVVVVLQMRMRNAAAHARDCGCALPETYWRAFRWWVALGWPALVAFIAIFYLMIAKPV